MDRLKIKKVVYSVPKYEPKYRNLYFTKDGRGYRGDGIYATKSIAKEEANKSLKEVAEAGIAISIDGKWQWKNYSHVEQINIII